MNWGTNRGRHHNKFSAPPNFGHDSRVEEQDVDVSSHVGGHFCNDAVDSYVKKKIKNKKEVTLLIAGRDR